MCRVPPSPDRSGATRSRRAGPRLGTRRRSLPAGRSGRRRRETPRILIVEDEPAARQVLRLLLEFDRYEVAAASNGHAALRTFDRFRPHLVIMDWRLPGPSGRDLHDAIQRRSHTDVPVVIVSSADEAFDPSQRCGVARLRKPLDVALFRAVVASNLAGRVDVTDS